jgi:DNA-binding NtrC family response regulator
MSDIRVLLADDEVNYVRLLETQLRSRGFQVSVVHDGREALERLKEDEYDVAVLDLVMPELDGISVLRETRETDSPPEVIILTGNETVETAVAAMKLGAADYVTKPCKVAELEIYIRKAHEKRQLQRENLKLKTQLTRQDQGAFPEIVTAGGMKPVLDLIEKVAPTDSPVLITGESGAGKELVARAIHRLSKRSEAPWIDINCAAISENLLESELFGHEKGSFTGATARKLGLFELADGGTLFMDEIAELAPRLQAKLLRALETGSFFRVGATKQVSTDLRLIAATNRDIEKVVEDGSFRQDLFYRISTLTIHVPPLRERPEDIPVLARRFLERAKPDAPRLSDEAEQVLRRYAWPGNVREVKNVMERVAILSAGPEITALDLPVDLRAGGAAAGSAGRTPVGAAVPLDDVEKEHIAAVLRRTSWHQGQAAKILGISPKTLYRKIREYGLQRPS